MKTSSKFILTGIASLMVVAGVPVMPANAELEAVSPTTVAGFPEWYEDSNGLRLDLCLAPSISRPQPGYCLTDPPDLKQPPSVDAENPANSNFPDEAFWWAAEAQVQRNNINAILVLATEAAFVNEDPIDGDQMVFNRTRIRIKGSALKANKKYKITYPYGEQILTAIQKDRRKPPEISFNQDFACAVSVTTACKFDDLLSPGTTRFKNLIGPWLRWPDNPMDMPPAGYIGDPNVPHTVIGSPIANTRHSTRFQNFFMVQEVDANNQPVGEVIAETDLFSVSGKLFAPPSKATDDTTTVEPASATTDPATAPTTGG